VQGRPVLGICGGFQMLCRRIDDPVESKAGRVAGLGLLDADIAFSPDKTLRHHDATTLYGYEIHHGQLERHSEDDWLGVGIRRGHVYGTHWHGLLDNDAVRRQWLADAAAAVGRSGFVIADDVDVAARRDAQLDLMADLLTAHLDGDAILALLDDGAPQRPTIVTRLQG
jgi:adenosylcobyric acid synthase